MRNATGTNPSKNKIVTLTKRKIVLAIEAIVVERKKFFSLDKNNFLLTYAIIKLLIQINGITQSKKLVRVSNKSPVVTTAKEGNKHKIKTFFKE